MRHVLANGLGQLFDQCGDLMGVGVNLHGSMVTPRRRGRKRSRGRRRGMAGQIRQPGDRTRQAR
jgi:hypothetical protein